jgi:hypothetical protein
MFGNDIITEALLLHGILYAGQSVTASNFATGLALCQTELNNMLAEWNAQGLAVFSVVRETFALTPGTANYVIGPDESAPWNVARPEKIEAWAVFDVSGASNGGSPVDSKTFAKMADDRSLASALITMLNYDAAYPDATIHLYPIPSGGTLELWVWEQFTAIVDFVATALAFPPGYLKAIVYNLAIDLAPLFGRQIDPGVQAIANATKQTLGATNISDLTRVPPQQPPPPKQI